MREEKKILEKASPMYSSLDALRPILYRIAWHKLQQPHVEAYKAGIQHVLAVKLKSNVVKTRLAT